MGDSHGFVADEKTVAGSSKSSRPATNGQRYMQTSGSNVVLVRRLKRKDEGLWKPLARWFVENQVGMLFFALFLFFAALLRPLPSWEETWYLSQHWHNAIEYASFLNQPQHETLLILCSN